MKTFNLLVMNFYFLINLESFCSLYYIFNLGNFSCWYINCRYKSSLNRRKYTPPATPTNYDLSQNEIISTKLKSHCPHTEVSGFLVRSISVFTHSSFFQN